MTCFHYRDQQAVPCCTRRRLVAKAALGVVTGAENRDLFWDAVCGKRDVDRRRKQLCTKYCVQECLQHEARARWTSWISGSVNVGSRRGRSDGRVSETPTAMKRGGIDHIWVWRSRSRRVPRYRMEGVNSLKLFRCEPMPASGLIAYTCTVHRGPTTTANAAVGDWHHDARVRHVDWFPVAGRGTPKIQQGFNPTFIRAGNVSFHHVS